MNLGLAIFPCSFTRDPYVYPGVIRERRLILMACTPKYMYLEFSHMDIWPERNDLRPIYSVPSFSKVSVQALLSCSFNDRIESFIPV